MQVRMHWPFGDFIVQFIKVSFYFIARLLLLVIWIWEVGESFVGKLYAWLFKWRWLVFQNFQPKNEM